MGTNAEEQTKLRIATQADDLRKVSKNLQEVLDALWRVSESACVERAAFAPIMTLWGKQLAELDRIGCIERRRGGGRGNPWVRILLRTRGLPQELASLSKTKVPHPQCLIFIDSPNMCHSLNFLREENPKVGSPLGFYRANWPIVRTIAHEITGIKPKDQVCFFTRDLLKLRILVSGRTNVGSSKPAYGL